MSNKKVTQILVPANSIADMKSAHPPEEPEDYEPLSENDPDFPSEDGQKLPAVRMTYRLPLNVLSERQQSDRLGPNWDRKTIKIVNYQTGLFTQLPKVCAGTLGCPFGAICPIENRDDFIGRSCPLEIQQLFTHFSGYVKDLNIKPENYTDIQLVTRLCRAHLIMWRTDMHMKLQDEAPDEVAVVSQKDSKVYYRPAMNKHRDLQRETAKEMDGILKQLIATRDAREAHKKGNTEEKNMASIFSKITDET